METSRARGLLLFAALAAAACHGRPYVLPALTCGADSCCAGKPQEVDCAENPYLQCSEPADETCSSPRSFGCADGSFVPPSPCPTPDAGDEGDDEAAAEDADFFVFPDVFTAPADATADTADAAVPEGGATD